MAFSAMDKTKIVMYLGMPGSVLDSNSVNYHTQVVDRLTGLTPQVEALARAKLTRIAALDTSLEGANTNAGVKRVDDIEFFGDGEKTRVLKRERNRVIRELGELLDIPAGTSGMVNIGL